MTDRQTDREIFIGVGSQIEKHSVVRQWLRNRMRCRSEMKIVIRSAAAIGDGSRVDTVHWLLCEPVPRL